MGDESSRLSRPHIAPRVFEPLGDPANRGLVVIALVTGLVTIPWLALVLYSDAISFVVINPFAKTGFELFLAAGQLFGALVLVLVPQDPMRLRWVAGGVLVLGLGAITFGYLYPLLHGSPNLTTVMYGALCARTVGSVLIAVGLVPAVVPRVKRPLVAGIAALISLLGGL